ncbi:MAG TPA: site-2 protease family protein [Candidatus Syntrophosphaera thermopropionivorans]|nr:site-2 protease family protein [Candidatus Syntrophosphaera thermopropionivorans]HPW25057.1 site-2 protease family protein [Candidatus Syntrophosphaera thermopropionivorans]
MNFVTCSMEFVYGMLNFFVILIIFYSIILHEISHALVSYWQGDDTAKMMGRLSLNPFKHIDIFGTIILPLLTYFTMGIILGYAKPVPLNPYNYKNIKVGTGLSALAGPVANILIAIVFALIFHLTQGQQIIPYICQMVVFFNLLLAFFNLIPIPPLDGSKVLGMLLPDAAFYKFMAQEHIGMITIIFILLVSGLLGFNIIGRLIIPPINFTMQLLGVGGIF